MLPHLTTRFHTRNGVVRAVEDVSFSVEKGQTVGIVGESGSGKSVTCYSLVGLIPQPPGRIHSGKAIFDGVDLLKAEPKHLRRIRGKTHLDDLSRSDDLAQSIPENLDPAN